MRGTRLQFDQEIFVERVVFRLGDVAPAKARIASSDSLNVTIRKCAVSPSTRRSSQAPLLPGVEQLSGWRQFASRLGTRRFWTWGSRRARFG